VYFEIPLGPLCRHLSDLLVKICSKHMRPFKAAEDAALVDLLHALDSRYVPPKRVAIKNRAM